MAKTQYNATAKVFDLSPIITSISPEDTPVISLIGRAPKAVQVLHSWEEDELASPRSNAQLEGFNYEVEDPGETTLKENVCQIFWRGYGITETNRVTRRENIKDVMAYNMQKAMKLIALDEEKAVIENTKMVRGNSSAPRQMGGLPFFIRSNVLGNGGTPRALTYNLLNDALERLYQAGGEPDVIVASPRSKRILSLLLPLNTDRTQAAASRSVVATIDVFEGDFGKQRVVTDRWLPDKDVYVLSKQYLGISFLRPFTKKDLPQQSDAIKRGIVGELTLECRAEKASARITDLNGTLPA